MFLGTADVITRNVARNREYTPRKVELEFLQAIGGPQPVDRNRPDSK